MLDIDEPATKLFNQGMLHKEGSVMSKSKGNVVLPEEVSNLVIMVYAEQTNRSFYIHGAPCEDRNSRPRRCNACCVETPDFQETLENHKSLFPNRVLAFPGRKVQ